MKLSNEVETQAEPVVDTPKPTRFSSRGDVSWKTYSNQWQENHGTALMAFACGVFLLGCVLIYFQQNRFRPPAFPSADAIQSVQGNLISPSSGLENGESGSLAGATRTIVTGAAEGGSIRIAIYRTPESFNDPGQAIWKQAFEAGQDGQATYDIPNDVLAEPFAIAVYHDKNNNEKLDRNALGIPTERYGFSNAARGKLGPPTFEEALIDRPAEGEAIELEIW
ncbi:DUF2141 domain-containing protein [Neorhodopirellula pilleata]|uniref:DUF2141 domain-containing protein n=1 Tax=Neorhodopirellula pilleata TaxID=2714738 RepID=A0A5C6AV08_9BACT|nr:DUF2141 domain-containing protein [Neorhodopirellula pilleata]TWU03845.1 hypothetical protein Pla100_07800 [Neorhodopirellula pilleata]